jgi:hypothetical protein
MANQKIYPRNLLILDRPYLAGFRNEHREYQASIGDLVALVPLCAMLFNDNI